MCSELFRIPIEYNGVPIFGFGFLMVVWLVVGVIAIVYVGRKTGWSGETWGYLPGIVLGAAAIALVPRLFPDGLPIRGYGTLVLVGAVTGIWLVMHRARQLGLDPEVLLSLAFSLFVCGILGARLFFVIEYWDTRFNKDTWRETLLEMAKFTEGGLVFYGSIIGGAIAYVVFARRHKLPVLALADLIVPSVMVGLAFGRLGCLMNGCCYGGETDHPWGVTFPHNSIPYVEQASTGRFFGMRIGPAAADNPRPRVLSVAKDGPAEEAGVESGTSISKINGVAARDVAIVQEQMLRSMGTGVPIELTFSNGESLEIAADEKRAARSWPVHPTQIYSAINAGLLAWFTWSFYPYRRKDGQVVALLLVLYPISRFLLEIIRIDESAVFGTGLSISQNISLVLLAGAVGMWVWLWNQPAEKTPYCFASEG